jgi:hypothetical protein
MSLAIGMGRQTLVRIENGSREPKDHEYEAMARVSGLPLGFFHAEDLDAVLGDGTLEPAKRAAGEALAQRLEVHHLTPVSEGGTNELDNLILVDPETHRLLDTLQARISQLEASVLAGRPESDAVLTRSGVDERRQPPGELGRDARGSTPSSQHPSPAGSERAGGSQRGNGEA